MKYGVIAVLFLIITSGISAEVPDSAVYIPDDKYVQKLVDEAVSQKLFDDPYWIRLLHYRKTLTGYKSRVDDPRFFLSADGRRSPRDEMIASIRAFFTPVVEGVVHPGIKNISRFAWLSERLRIDQSKLPFDFIAKFNTYYESLGIAKAVVVFPAGYVNSPASMFGHTLLVLESSKGGRLASLAVNYAAITDEKFGPIFAFKGLFGLYSGRFSLLAYYEKINEYSNGEMRDMWEYSLNLDDAELKRLLMHIVEMDGINSPYYFIDDNCSMNLLYLLEIARPETDLSDGFMFKAEPIDTLRAVIKSGMVDGRIYRPSLYAKILRTSDRLEDGESAAAVDFAKGKISGNEFNERISSNGHGADACDLAADYLKFLAVKDSIDLDAYRERSFEVLRMRSKMTSDAESQPRENVQADPPPPEQSHKSDKFTFGGGFDGSSFARISLHPTYHELIDSDIGLSRDNEIVFGHTALRYYLERKKLVLESFDLVRILAMPGSNRFFSPACFSMDAGVHQAPSPDAWKTTAGYLYLGSGYSVTAGSWLHMFLMARCNTDFSNVYERNSFIAFGARGGFVADITDVFKCVVFGESCIVPFGDKTYVHRVYAQQRIRFTSRTQISGSFCREYHFSRARNEYVLNAELMF